MTDEETAGEAQAGSTWTVGSVADEAVQFLAAVKRWAEQQQTHEEGHGDASDAGGAESCRYCPICQVISVARKSHPEILDQLGQSVEGVVAAIRASILSQEKQWEARPEPRVQHIDIDVAD